MAEWAVVTCQIQVDVVTEIAEDTEFWDWPEEEQLARASRALKDGGARLTLTPGLRSIAAQYPKTGANPKMEVIAVKKGG